MKRTLFDKSQIKYRPLTSYRLLGFIEGDGSFNLPNLLPSLTIKQHSKNIHFLYEIAEYLNKLPYNPELGSVKDILNTRPTAGVSNSEVWNCNLHVTNILQLYNYILPFFKTLKFRTRKVVDFELWELAVKLKALGYTTTIEGKKALVSIDKYINKRYTNKSQLNEAPDLNLIKGLLKTKPIFDLSSGLSYKALSDVVKVSKKGNKGYGVNVYENDVLIKGSPFPSDTQAALAMGNINISSIISKKINTDKLYKGKYRFESIPL